MYSKVLSSLCLKIKATSVEVSCPRSDTISRTGIKLMNFPLPKSVHNALREGIFQKVAVVIITISLSTVSRIHSKLFETSSGCNRKRSSASSMLQNMSFK